MHSGNLVLKAAKKKRFVSCYRIRQSILTLAEEGYTKNTAAKIAELNNELNSLKKILETTYVNSLMRWNETKRVIFIVLFGVLIFVGLLSIVYSHRIAGPLFRIRRCVDILAQGKDIPPIRLRKRDEFKGLADSLDKLRSTLKDKGLLESE
jgi:methyl-accepting chemotaxis protein